LGTFAAASQPVAEGSEYCCVAVPESTCSPPVIIRCWDGHDTPWTSLRAAPVVFMTDWLCQVAPERSALETQ
jgi:hypothetical protein